MPVLSKPSNWARGISKSLTKRLHLKTVKRRLSDPFNRRVHSYTTSTEENSKVSKKESGSKPTKKNLKSKKKEYLSKKEKPVKCSVGIQVDLPPRSLIEELSHAGSVDVMSYFSNYHSDTTGNSNSNNSVDWYHTSSVSSSASKAVTPKHGSYESKTPAKPTGGRISSRKAIPVASSVLPSKVTPISTKSSKASSSSSTKSSNPPPSYHHSGASAVKNMRNASTLTDRPSPPASPSKYHNKSASSNLTATPSSSTTSRLKTQCDASTTTTSSSLLKSHQRALSPSSYAASPTTATTSSFSSQKNRHASSSSTPSSRHHYTSSYSARPPSPTAATTSSSSSQKNRQTISSSTPPTSHYQPTTATSMADSYLRFSNHRMTTAAAIISHYTAPLNSSPTLGRPASPSMSRRLRTGSLPSPVSEFPNQRREQQSIKTRTDYSSDKSHLPVTMTTPRRQRSNSYSEPMTGHSSPLLHMREHSIPKTIHRGSTSPPAYQQSPIVKDKCENLEKLVNQSDFQCSSSSSRHYHSAYDVSKSDTSAKSSSLVSTATKYDSPRQGHSQNRSDSVGQKDSPRHHTDKHSGTESYIGCGRSNSESAQSHSRARSPSPSPRHSARKKGSGTGQGSDSLLSDARQRRVTQKKQENSATNRTIGDSDVMKSSLSADERNNSYEQKLDSKEPSISYSLSRSSLRRSNSLSSVADSLKWEERVSSPDATIENTTRVLSSRGSFDDIREIGLTGGKRKKSPKHRVRTLLKKITPTKKMPGQATQVYVSNITIEQMFATGGLVGLINVGNTCYMNSMLQCLSHTLEMTQMFLHPQFTSNNQITKAYSQLMKEIWKMDTPLSITTNTFFNPEKYHSLAPHSFKRAIATEYPQYSGSEQQDAQEFMRHLISSLHEEMKMPVSRKYSPFQFRLDVTGSHKEQAEKAWHTYRLLEDSFVSEVFMGQLKSTLQCSVCKGASVTFDPFWDICLTIPKPKRKKDPYSGICSKSVDLSDCIKEFTRVEVLDGDERPVCASCGKFQRSIKRMTIQRFPPVLVLMLKRFTGFWHRCKLDTDVGIPQTLDLSAHASDDSDDQPVKYELYASSNHIGGTTYGHYTAWVKHYATQEWYEYNDSGVSKLSSRHPVMKSTVHSSQPYVLFYRRATTMDH